MPSSRTSLASAGVDSIRSRPSIRFAVSACASLSDQVRLSIRFCTYADGATTAIVKSGTHQPNVAHTAASGSTVRSPNRV